MINSTAIRHLADLRLQEAEALLQAGLCEGALYLAGYAVELLLKAQICDNLDIENLFDESFKEKEIAKPFKTHNLDHLLWLSGLKGKFEQDKITNPILFKNWAYITVEWNEKLRYQVVGSVSSLKVHTMLEAINHSVNGFKQWILSY